MSARVPGDCVAIVRKRLVAADTTAASAKAPMRGWMTSRGCAFAISMRSDTRCLPKTEFPPGACDPGHDEEHGPASRHTVRDPRGGFVDRPRVRIPAGRRSCDRRCLLLAPAGSLKVIPTSSAKPRRCDNRTAAIPGCDGS